MLLLSTKEIKKNHYTGILNLNWFLIDFFSNVFGLNTRRAGLVYKMKC